MKQAQIYGALFLAVAAVSTSAIFVELSSAPPAIIATYRLLFAVLLMTPYMLSKRRHEFRQLTRKDGIFCLLAGAFLAAHFIFWFASFQYTSVTSSVVLVALQPIFAFAGTYYFFREKIAAGHFIGGGLAIAGSILISWGDFRVRGLALYGDLLALFAAALVTVYFLFGQEVRKRIPVMAYTFLVYSAASFCLILYDLIRGLPLIGYPKKEWLLFLLLAIVPTLLGHSIFNWIIKWVSTNVVSISILGEPIGASILAYFLLDETIRPLQWIGGTMILSGIYLFLRVREQTSFPATKRASSSNPFSKKTGTSSK